MECRNLLRSFLAVAWMVCVMAGAPGETPRNVILFIGDGMGTNHVQVAAGYKGEPLSFEAFPNQGLVATYSANATITDSAAGGTALATGRKVNNGVISKEIPGDGSELETLLEYAKARGKQVGLVSTTYITHATPASFGAHEDSRGNYTQIGYDYLNQTQPNVLFGGDFYIRNIIDSNQNLYAILNTQDDLDAIQEPTYTIQDEYEYEYVSGQFSFGEGDGSVPYETGDSLTPHYLSKMTRGALNILDNDTDGFFLMVEGGKIDWASHSNSMDKTIYETLEFSNAVQVAIDWATNRTDTLILVTADHETGGLTIHKDLTPGVIPNVETAQFTSGDHTAADVPIYAWGVNANLVGGQMDNTDIYGIVVQKAYAPSPVDGATMVNAASVVFEWNGLAGATEYNVYWGTTAVDENVVTVRDLQYVPTVAPDTIYRWRVDVVKEGGILEGDVWTFTTAPPSSALIPMGSVWRYESTGTDLSKTSWKLLSYNDTDWPAGPGILGYGDTHQTTNIRYTGDLWQWCYYFRHTFSVEDPSSIGSLIVDLVRDDGAVVYLNGVEILRSNIAEGDVAFDTKASTVIGYENEYTPVRFVVPASNLVPGDNVIAVEVHQENTNSSDISFDLELNGTRSNTIPVADPKTFTLLEDTTLPIALTGSDADGDQLTYQVVSPPAHGTITGTLPAGSYTPHANFYGSDSFTFVVNDGFSDSVEAIVILTIDPVDDPITAPTHLQAEAGIGEVTLTWDAHPDPDGDLTGFKVYRDGALLISLTGKDLVTWTDTNGTVGVEYTYTLSATYDGPAESPLSNPAVATPKSIPLDAYALGEPTVLYGAVTGTVDGVDEAWDGLTQTITESPNGQAGMSSLDVEYVLYTPATVITKAVLVADYQWTNGDGAKDALQILVATWEGDTRKGEVSLEAESAGPLVYDLSSVNISPSGTIHVIFRDSAAIRKETRDILTIDRLYATIEAGTPPPPDNVPPAAPTDLTGSADNAAQTINLTWTPNTESDLAGYRVYRSTSSDGPYTLLTPSLISDATFLDAPATWGPWYYVVTAVDQSGNESPYSDFVVITLTDIPPAAPQSLTAEGGFGEIRLDWADNSEADWLEYRIYRRLDSEQYDFFNPSEVVTISEWNDTTVESNTTYYYVVKAVDIAGNESSVSPEVSATATDQPQFITLSVSSVTVEVIPGEKKVYATATVTVASITDGASAGVLVTGDWYQRGAPLATGVSGITDVNGKVVLESPERPAKSGDVFEFVVRDLGKDGCLFDGQTLSGSDTV